MFKKIFFILFLNLFLTAFCHSNYKFSLSVCAIFQDEAPFLKEWIEFHKMMGVEHFYLYNHRSQDNYQEVLQPYLQSGIVELINKSNAADTLKAFNALQCKCYTECLKQAKGKSKWVAFLDIDEFLFPIQKNNLKEVLKDYEKFGGIGVNWLMFGPSHVWSIPEKKLFIESLTCCAEKKYRGNRYVKSIVRPDCTSHFDNPHQPVYQEGFYEVNTDKLPMEEMWSSYYKVDKLRINHYWTRHGEFFYDKKLKRHKQWRGDPQEGAIEDFIKNLNAEQNTDILRFLPALKKAMAKQ